MYQYCSIAWYVQYLPKASIAHTAVCAILAKKQYCNAILDTTGIHASPGIITVTDGAGEVIKREAGCATGLGPVAHDGGRSFCATATSAGLDGADLIRRC